MINGTLFHIPLEVATTPADGDCLTARWWSVHPEKGIEFYFQAFGYARSETPHPQCNPVETIARLLQERLWPDHTTQFVPVVFLAHAEREMARIKSEMRKEQGR